MSLPVLCTLTNIITRFSTVDTYEISQIELNTGKFPILILTTVENLDAGSGTVLVDQRCPGPLAVAVCSVTLNRTTHLCIVLSFIADPVQFCESTAPNPVFRKVFFWSASLRLLPNFFALLTQLRLLYTIPPVLIFCTLFGPILVRFVENYSCLQGSGSVSGNIFAHST
jgi:hypothetical protein